MQLRECLKEMIPYTAGKTETGAIKLSSNENPLGPSPLAMEAVARALSGMNRYPDGASALLREKIGARIGLPSGQLIIGNGSDEILAFLAGAYIATGTNGITASNTFSEYTFSIKLFDGEIRKVPLKQGRFDLEGILAAVDGNTRIIFICNPNNPTGTFVTQKELDKFLNHVPENLLVVIDEAYQDFADDPDFPKTIPMLAARKNLFVTRTFSKLYGLAGLRIGYGAGHADTINDLFRTKQAFNVNLAAQAAAAAALEDADFVSRSLSLVKEGKEQVCQGLERLGIPFYPTQANFICFETGEDSEALFKKIILRGIAVRPLKSFGLPTSIRYTFGTRDNNELFLSILSDWKKGAL
jgi:histidinol-phosphate aminotransferase